MTKTLFPWIEAARSDVIDSVNRRPRRWHRHTIVYAAVSAQNSTDETYEEFKATTSGHTSRSTYEWLQKDRRERAVELFNIARNRGFVDC